MLHNSGPYGPSEPPVNVGGSLNVTPINGQHITNNLTKIPQQSPHPPQTHYNLPNYSNFGHTPLNMSAQMSHYPTYPLGSYPNNFLPHNLGTAHNSHIHNAQHYSLPSASSVHESVMHHNQPYLSKLPFLPHENQSLYSKPSLNIPQIHPREQRHPEPIAINNYSHYQVNNDYLDDNLDLRMKPNEKTELELARRRSLENTVKIIENFLMNTSTKQDTEPKNYEKSYDAHEIDNRKNNNYNHTDVRETIITETKVTDPKITETSSETNNTETNDIETNDTETNDIANNQTSMETETEDTKDDENSDDSENDIKPDVSEDLKNPVEALVEIKVEPMDSEDHADPFVKDMHGSARDNIEKPIFSIEESVEKAKESILKGLQPEYCFECQFCSLVFDHPKRFLIHSKWHSFGLTNDKRLEMARNKEIERNQKREARIMERLHAKEIQAAEDGVGLKKYSCKDCDKVFCVKSTLANHRQREHPSKVRECKICKKVLPNWMALRAHVETHTTESGYQCIQCPKKFKYSHSLTKHMDTHKEKTHPCTECPKKFGSVALLKMHMKSHERAQRGLTFHCTYCGKGFYESYNLQVHERTHRNERPYLCTICNTSFGTNSSLKRHIKVSHNKNKPFECDTCHKYFKTDSILERHIQRAHGNPEDFKFVCNICPCRYMKLKDLRKHINKAHPKSKRKKHESDSE